jgi:CHAT domain-containing protein
MELGKRDIAGEPPLKVLVLISQPEEPGLAEVIADPVLGELRRSAEEGLPVELTVRHQPTRDMLFDLMPELRPDIVQFMGHGRYNEDDEQGEIAFVDETGRADWVGEAVLAQLLGDPGDMPRLVYLHSCAGAQADYQASFAGLAPRLIRRGVQCVVAMQYAVTNRTAIAFSKGFYRALTTGLPLDEAVQAGRYSLGVLYERDPRLIGIPVVYLHSLGALLTRREE